MNEYYYPEYRNWKELFEAMEELPPLDEIENDDGEGNHYLVFQDKEKDILVVVLPSDGKKKFIPGSRFREMQAMAEKVYCLNCGGEIGVYFDFESPEVFGLCCRRCNIIHKLVDGQLCLTA